MKTFLKILAAAVGLLGIILAAVILGDETDGAVIEKYVSNEKLKTVRADWRGTPVDEKGRFVNHEFPYLPKYSKILRWMLSRNPQREEKLRDTARLPVLDPTAFFESGCDGILWLGHASFYIRLAGKTILLDPVFGEPRLLRPLVAMPSPIDRIKQVDYVLLSHDHRDHADEDSIRALARKFPAAKFLGGLRLEDLLKDWVGPANEIQTAGWFQQFALPDENVKITFLPVRHWCRRGLFDTNHILWGGYVIEGSGRTIYFSGDSGFGSHYRETGELFPSIDYFLIGIGAYKPQYMMKEVHNTPEEALAAFVDARARILVPMHYGRFDMADEPPSEPLRLLKEAALEKGLSEHLKPLSLNEGFYFED
ncbi:MAG: MBL fold metallo-hydrolase [Acidobacteria bacterium]|nr:MBL fold metallo-hydrolase [Acidobacteriota bacterium]